MTKGDRSTPIGLVVALLPPSKVRIRCYWDDMKLTDWKVPMDDLSFMLNREVYLATDNSTLVLTAQTEDFADRPLADDIDPNWRNYIQSIDATEPFGVVERIETDGFAIVVLSQGKKKGTRATMYAGMGVAEGCRVYIDQDFKTVKISPVVGK